MTEPHVLFSDVVPYEVPSSLYALQGPSGGIVTLPLHVWCGPAPTFDLNRRADLLVALSRFGSCRPTSPAARR